MESKQPNESTYQYLAHHLSHSGTLLQLSLYNVWHVNTLAPLQRQSVTTNSNLVRRLEEILVHVLARLGRADEVLGQPAHRETRDLRLLQLSNDGALAVRVPQDRKSTRLNSSHT